MNQHTQAAQNDLAAVAHDARTLLAASSHVARERVVAALKRLSTALDSVKDTRGRNGILPEAGAQDICAPSEAATNKIPDSERLSRPAKAAVASHSLAIPKQFLWLGQDTLP